MNREQAALLRRIDSFEFDDPAVALKFTARLARENGWSIEYARRVVEEYKRFLFLAMVADHEVTPSDEVDQAWHLHLAYTRSYWDELCGRVLKRSLHHGPTKGGRCEAVRFEDQYRRSLTSYEQWFGTAPPSDIWPPSEQRFSPRNRFVRVNLGRHWLIHKPKLLGAAGSIAAAVTAVAFVAAAGPGQEFDELSRLMVAVAIVGAIILVATIVNLVFGKNRKGRSGDSKSNGCGGGFFGCSGDGGNHDASSGCGTSGCGSGCGGGCGGGGD